MLAECDVRHELGSVVGSCAGAEDVVRWFREADASACRVSGYPAIIYTLYSTCTGEGGGCSPLHILIMLFAF